MRNSNVMTAPPQPYREPLRATLARTLTTAAILGAGLTWVFRSGIRNWPIATLLALWPVLGGHWVEIFFLNGLRPRLPAERRIQVIARIATWFVGGCVLMAGMHLTAVALGRTPRWPAWWIGGVAFIGIELVVHLVLSVLGRDSFYNGRG